MLAAIHQRIVDWLRERRIERLRVQAMRAYEDADHPALRRIGARVFAECEKRSPQQVARMEKALSDSLDPHARAVLERAKGVFRA